MNPHPGLAQETRAAVDEYNRYEGTPVREIVTFLWDHGCNRKREARCLLIDLGRRPPVDAHLLTREDRALFALRRRRMQPHAQRSYEAQESLSKRLHAWLKTVGAATQYQAAEALGTTPHQALHLLTSNAHLFRLYKKIARQSYFVAV